MTGTEDKRLVVVFRPTDRTYRIEDARTQALLYGPYKRRDAVERKVESMRARGWKWANED
jgi:hypothetical protein